MKTVLRWVAVGLLGILVLSGAALLFFSSPPGEALLRDEVEDRLGRALEREARIGRLQTNLFSLLRLEEVRLGPPAAQPESPPILLDTVTVQYYLPALLFGRELRVRSLEAEGLSLSLPAAGQPGLNDPAAGRPGPDDPAAAAPPLPAHGGFPALVRLDSARLRSLRLNISGQELLVDELSLGPLTWGPQSAAVENLKASLQNLAVTGRVELGQSGAEYPLAGRLKIEGNPRGLLDAFRLPAAAAGLLIDAELSGTLAAPRLAVQGRLPQVEVAGLPLSEVLLEADWDGATLALRRLDVRALGGTLQGTGRLRTAEPWEAELQVGLDGLELASFWSALYGAASPFTGTLDGRLQASGPLAAPRQGSASAELNLAGLSYREQPLADIAARLEYREETAEGTFRQEGNAEATARLLLAAPGPSGSFFARVTQLEPLAALAHIEGLSGSARAEGSLSGRWEAPRLQARIDASGILYQGFPVDTLEAELEAGDRELVFSRLVLSGRLDTIDPQAPPFGLAGLSGGLQYSGTLSGAPQELAGRVSATLTRPAYGELRFGQGSLQARLAGNRILLDSLVLVRERLRLAASGSFDLAALEGSLEMDLSTDGAADGHLSALLALPEEQPLVLQASGKSVRLDALRGLYPGLPDVGGRASFTLEARDTRPSPEAELRLSVSYPRFRELLMQSLEADLQVQGGKLRLGSLDLRGEGAGLQATATLGMGTGGQAWSVSADSPFSGTARAGNLNLEVLVPFLPAGMRTAGNLSLDLSWEGTLASPLPTGTLDLQEGDLLLPGQDAPDIRDLRMSAVLRGKELTLSSLNARVRDIALVMKGKLETSDWKQVRLALSATPGDLGQVDISGLVSPDALNLEGTFRKLDLGAAARLVPGLPRMGGALTGTVALRGRPEDPRITGRVEAGGLSAEIPGLPLPLEGGRLAVSFQDQRITVEDFTARLGEGLLKLSGGLSHRDGALESAELDVGIRGVVLERPGLYVLNLRSAALRFHGSGEQYVLEGDVAPGDSRLLQNIQPQELIELARPSGRPAAPLPVFLEKMRLNIRLRGADQLWMTNNLGRVRLQAAVSLIGTLTRPVLSGRLTVEEGYLTFLDRRFTIRRGIADFQNTAGLNPFIDLEAGTEVRALQMLQSVPFDIRLTLRGPLDTLEMNLSSDPPLERAGIISLLALGIVRGQISAEDPADQPFGDLLLMRAGEIASQKLTQFVGREIEDMLGLEEFSVEGNLFDIGGEDNPDLRATKRISDNLELTYSTNLGVFDEHNLELDYKLNENLTLQGQVNQDGEAAVRLKFGIELK